MIAALFLAVALDTVRPSVDTGDILDRVERWMDTALVDDRGGKDGYQVKKERMHLREKGAGKVNVGVFPTFYASPFYRERYWC